MGGAIQTSGFVAFDARGAGASSRTLRSLEIIDIFRLATPLCVGTKGRDVAPLVFVAQPGT